MSEIPMVCCVKGCDDPEKALGLCSRHYARIQARDHLLRDNVCAARHGLSNEDRFFSWVDKVEGDGCWNWKGYLNLHGYGIFTERKEGKPGSRRNVIAHRKAYEIAHGPIPFGMVIRHKCDNKQCVRIDHLEVGTQADNARDNYERGLLVGRPGETNHAAKINEEIVREIRNSKEDVYTLAKRYNVSVPLIYKVRSRTTWKHVT